jgi:hypothetical protein
MIKFRKVSHFGQKYKNAQWESAKDENDLIRKMGRNCLAEIEVTWFKKLYYKLFPVHSYERGKLFYHIHNGKVTAETC